VKILGSYGFLGIAVFFGISGFMIPLSMTRSGYSPAKFILRRLVRLEPVYLVSVALVIFSAIILSPFNGVPIPPGLSWSALLHVAYIAPWFETAWLNPVYWSPRY
jgi:peptidoglycan/LPS O-acetylase OafA/YrhL